MANTTPRVTGYDPPKLLPVIEPGGVIIGALPERRDGVFNVVIHDEEFPAFLFTRNADLPSTVKPATPIVVLKLETWRPNKNPDQAIRAWRVPVKLPDGVSIRRLKEQI